MQELKKCPICDVSNSIKILNLIESFGMTELSLECTHCKAKWSAWEDDVDKWFILTNPSNTNVGTAKSGLINMMLPLKLWLNKNKPFLKIERYAATIYEYFGDFEDYGEEIGHAEFEDGSKGVFFIGPSKIIVASIRIEYKNEKDNYDIKIAVIDQTEWTKEKDRTNDREKAYLFLYMIAKKLYIFTEETGISIIPYLLIPPKEAGKNLWTPTKTIEVEENWFYPFKDLDVRPVTTTLGDSGRDIIKEFSELKPNKTKKKTFEAKPNAKKLKAKPDIVPQPVEKKPPKPDLAPKVLKSLFCTNCGSKVEEDAVFCGKCGKRVLK